MWGQTSIVLCPKAHQPPPLPPPPFPLFSLAGPSPWGGQQGRKGKRGRGEGRGHLSPPPPKWPKKAQKPIGENLHIIYPFLQHHSKGAKKNSWAVVLLDWARSTMLTEKVLGV